MLIKTLALICLVTYVTCQITEVDQRLNIRCYGYCNFFIVPSEHRSRLAIASEPPSEHPPRPAIASEPPSEHPPRPAIASEPPSEHPPRPAIAEPEKNPEETGTSSNKTLEIIVIEKGNTEKGSTNVIILKPTVPNIYMTVTTKSTDSLTQTINASSSENTSLPDVDVVENGEIPVVDELPATVSPAVDIMEEGSGGANTGQECLIDGARGVCVPFYRCSTDGTQVLDNPLDPSMDYETEQRPEDIMWDTSETALAEFCSSAIDQCCLGYLKRKGCGRSYPDHTFTIPMNWLENRTKFAEFPWMSAILLIEQVNNETFNNYIGGGSLIHPSVVMTTATVASTVLNDNQVLRVRLGEWDTTSVREPVPHQDRDVASVVVHKEYKRDNRQYDIALLFLTSPVTLTRNVGPACLPPPDATPKGSCYLTGWGKGTFGGQNRYQTLLKKLRVPIVSKADCEASLREPLKHDFKLHSSSMCAGAEGGHDACKGDEGSPLSCPIQGEPGRYVQTGIVSWGVNCGQDRLPSIYVDTAKLRSWIDQTVKDKGYNTEAYSF